MREPDFELSADMRLLELQRGALGLPPRERTAWETRAGTDAGVLVEAIPEEAGSSAVLALEAVAFPMEGVIAGAIVTLTLSLSNEGATEARDVVAGAPLPGGAAYRPGSFVWDGRSSYDDVAESFFGAGLPIGSLAAGQRAAFQWKISVRLGSAPLVVVPQARARGAAVVGGRPVTIGRKLLPGAGAFGSELSRAQAAIYEPQPLLAVDIPASELPLYELDTEEQLVYEAADAAMSSATREPAVDDPPSWQVSLAAAQQPGPPQHAPSDATPLTPPDQTPAYGEAPPVEQPAVEPPAVEPPAVEPPAPREAVILYGRFDRTTLAFFERVFLGGKPPTILQHCIFGGALACACDERGLDGAALKRHLDAQSQVLHRIVLHEKLGKKEPIAEYSGQLLAQLDTILPHPVVAAQAPADALVLLTELSEPTRAVLMRLFEERARWDFVKARQLTLALQAQSIAGLSLDPDVRDQAERSLRAYAQASVGALQKLFVRIRIDRTTGVLFQTDEALDAGARAVVAALKQALS